MSAVVPALIVAVESLSTLLNPTFALVVPARMAAVESVFAPSPPAVTCPPPPPLNVPSEDIVRAEFVKDAILVKPVPPLLQLMFLLLDLLKVIFLLQLFGLQ